MYESPKLNFTMGKAELKKIPDKLTDAEKKKVKNENKVSHDSFISVASSRFRATRKYRYIYMCVCVCVKIYRDIYISII